MVGLFSLFSTQSRQEKIDERYKPLLVGVNKLGDHYKRLNDGELRAIVARYKGAQWSEIEAHLPEVFAAVREAADRRLAMRHFDVQILGGLSLLDGKIAEMKTGEGKTLVATLSLVARALEGRGAHLVTVNDYLSQRDADWMRPVYDFFNLSVSVIHPGQSFTEKKAAYAADIAYGTNNEFGFDYLRDNMALHPEELVQRELYYAIVDEVDSILIDEARTPLIISAPDAESTQMYELFARLVPQLKENEHYNVDEKRRAVTLTDEGIERVERLLGLGNIYEERGIRFVHHLEQALRAHTLYHRDKDYVVQNGQVIIVDEFTGRLMHGRRYSEGLHQAIEAKEKVAVQHESRTLATITLQNYFRLYQHLAGMTGTAVTSAEEFEKVYNLEVAVMPTNKPMIRADKPDRISVNEAVKFRAVVEEIKQRHTFGQPVLVGTIAIEKSERLSAMLSREGILHEVLNAKHHAREAEIIAKAGQTAAVTISTNMAGRGTDIKLGEGVVERGGLFVLGTERHEARRIDNQLRGRSGRQGDPGETQFFISLEDDVMRIFGGDRIRNLMQRLRLPEDQPIENRLVSRALEGAQERVEGYYFDMRKQVLAYDDVLNRQRSALYALRRGVLVEGVWREVGRDPEELHAHVVRLVEEEGQRLVTTHASNDDPTRWNSEEIAETMHALTGKPLVDLHKDFQEAVNRISQEGPQAGRERVANTVVATLQQCLAQREQEMGSEVFKKLERAAALRAIDVHWMEHLDTMDYLRAGIGLRGYGQRDPLVEYQREGYQLFQRLLATITAAIVEIVFKAQAVRTEHAPQAIAAPVGLEQNPLHQLAATQPVPAFAQASAGTSAAASTTSSPHGAQPVRAAQASGPLHNPYKKVGRNDPCPCGSGKKFKKCHGR